jgi:hypothetical protein
MSTKLSFLSRAAVVAGVLALGLPAFAQTSQPAAPTANPVVAPKTAIAPSASPSVAPTSPDKATGKVVEQKTDKSKHHAAKKPLVKTAKNVPTQKAAMPATDAKNVTPPAKTDAGK